MTIKCGVCGKQIPSHMVERRRGSHYSEYYDDVEEILHPDLGKILKMSITDELKQKLSEIQKQKEKHIVKNAFLDEFRSYPYDISKHLDSIDILKDLIKRLNKVVSTAEHNHIVVKSVEKIGRHTTWRTNGLNIPDIDICKDCFNKFEQHQGIYTLGYIDRNIPSLRLSDFNIDIWNDIKGCTVEIELDKY